MTQVLYIIGSLAVIVFILFGLTFIILACIRITSAFIDEINEEREKNGKKHLFHK